MKEKTKNIISVAGSVAGLGIMVTPSRFSSTSEALAAVSISGLLIFAASAKRPIERSMAHLMRDDGKFMKFLRDYAKGDI